MIKVDESVLSRPPEEGARIVALRLLGAAQTALDRIPAGDDPEALHDFRVNVRRLRSSLRAYRPFLKRRAVEDALLRLKTLGSRTNRARDHEVQIEWLEDHKKDLRRGHRPALGWLVEYLGRRKTAAYAGALDGVPEQFAAVERDLRRSLASYRTRVQVAGDPGLATFAGVTSDLLRDHVVDLERLLAAISSVHDEEPSHRARIQAKRLRYLIEPVSREVEDGRRVVKMLKGLQDLLGEQNDLHVLTATLRSTLEQVALERADHVFDAVIAGDADAVARARRRSVENGLLAIARVVSDRQHKLFGQLEAEWLHGHGQAFFDRVGELASRLTHIPIGVDDATPTNLEIERKFLLDALPERAAGETPFRVEQGWLPGQEIRERLRRVVDPAGETRYYRTIKLGEGIARQEFEEEMPGHLFHQLWPGTLGVRVCKRRYVVREGEFAWEVDAFDDRPLVLAEIELPAVDTEFELPEWLAPHLVREVTGERDFTNLYLAR